MKSKIVSSRSCIRVLLPMMDTRCGESLQYHPRFHRGPQRCTRFTAAPLKLFTSTLLISLLSKFCVTETQHSRDFKLISFEQLVKWVFHSHGSNTFPKVLNLEFQRKHGDADHVWRYRGFKKNYILMKRQPAGSRLYSQRDFKNR